MDNANTHVRAAESPDGARRANANISPTVIGWAKYPFTPRLCVGPCTLHACLSLSLPPFLLLPLSLSFYPPLSFPLQHRVSASPSWDRDSSKYLFRVLSALFEKSGTREDPGRERRLPSVFQPLPSLKARTWVACTYESQTRPDSVCVLTFRLYNPPRPDKPRN